jgi:hypothetical protein
MGVECGLFHNLEVRLRYLIPIFPHLFALRRAAGLFFFFFFLLLFDQDGLLLSIKLL